MKLRNHYQRGLFSPSLFYPKSPLSHQNIFRYDARLLLDPQTFSSTGTNVQDHAIPIPSSPAGWSDLPSDAEDTFFFTAGETGDYRREKRRRLMEQTRDERLKARMEEDGEEIWGGSDEEVGQHIYAFYGNETHSTIKAS